MSEAYNPETSLYEQLASLEIQAKEIARKRDSASGEDRTVLDKQLKEVETQVTAIKRRLKP